MHINSVSLAISLAGILAVSAWGQVDTGSILGQVTDQSGGIVPGAKVTLENEDTGAIQTTATNEHGDYSFSPVRIGVYSISVERTGFSRAVRSHVTVNIQQQLVINFTLQPGSVQQTVNVISSEPLLQTENASVGQVIQSRQINDLPLNGRNYFFLAQLAAGVSFGQKDIRGEDSNGRFSANGTRPTQNDYLLDGIDNNSSIISRQNGKDFVVQTPVDALSEFKIQTNNYSAEFGRSAGAVMNATVKSGTNQFHGDAWEFLRNNALDANDFFLNAAGKPNPEFRRNQFGFTQGGPIVLAKLYNGRDKTFFFIDYEGTRIRQGNTDTGTVPTLMERNSGFTNFSDLVMGQTGTYTDALGRTFPAGTIFDPATTRVAGNSYIRDPFPGNILPASRIDPNAVKLLDLLPDPTRNGIFNNYVVAPVFADDIDSFDIRIDENLSEKGRFFGRYSYNNLRRIHPGPFPGYADGGDSLVNSNLNDLAQNGLLGETHIFSPNFVNEFRIGINREHALWLQPFGDVPGIPEQFGIHGVPQNPQNGGLPQFNVGSLSRFGSYGFLPSSKYGTTPQITDDLTFTRGVNTLKIGFEGQRVIYPFTQPPQSRGALSFSGVFTSVVGQTDSTTGIAQLLLAPTGSSNLAGANQVQLSNFITHNLIRNYVGAYLQDDWKVTSKLTLNLGIRYDYFSFPHDRLGQLANFQPGLNLSGGTYFTTPQVFAELPPTFISALAAEGVNIQKDGQELGDVQTLNFAPRFGFAYHLLSHLVIRGGYGIFYGGIEEIGGSPLITENFPIEYTVTRTNSSPVTPIVADNSIGLLETSFQNLSLNPATVNPVGVPLIGFQHNWKTPYTQSENLMLEYQVNQFSTFTIGYVGSNSRHIETVLNPNSPLQLLPPGTNLLNYVPYPRTALSGNNYTETAGSSNYNSLQITFEKRFSSGFSLLADFTWQKTLTDARDPLENDIGGYRAPWLPGFGIEHDFALADFDVPRMFHLSGTYELPFGPGKQFASSVHGLLGALVSGWSMNWIATAQDGQPFTVGCARATSTGFGCNALMAVGVNPYAGSSVSHFVNAAAFLNPPVVNSVGQANYAPLGGAATQVTGPPFRRLDFSVFKRFSITERVYTEIRSEIFNLTNTPNFANPSNLNFANLTNFGQITATRDSPNDPREIQFGLKLYW